MASVVLGNYYLRVEVAIMRLNEPINIRKVVVVISHIVGLIFLLPFIVGLITSLLWFFFGIPDNFIQFISGPEGNLRIALIFVLGLVGFFCFLLPWVICCDNGSARLH